VRSAERSIRGVPSPGEVANHIKDGHRRCGPVIQGLAVPFSIARGRRGPRASLIVAIAWVRRLFENARVWRQLRTGRHVDFPEPYRASLRRLAGPLCIGTDIMMPSASAMLIAPESASCSWRRVYTEREIRYVRPASTPSSTSPAAGRPRRRSEAIARAGPAASTGPTWRCATTSPASQGARCGGAKEAALKRGIGDI